MPTTDPTPLDRRGFLRAGALTVGGLTLLEAPGEALAGAAGETLYNGIRLPAPWPPRGTPLTAEPMPVPYLASPPAVIPIDVGRQLFVDDFLIERTTLRRAFHAATYHKATPVLRPDRKWEQTGQSPCAMAFSDGVWYDPADRLFKMWYMGGLVRSTCLATSRDGIRWEKPALDVQAGTNVVHPGSRDSTTVWLDLEEKDPKRRYKFFRSHRHERGWALSLHFSPDGVHWADAGLSGPCGDRTTVFYNPFRRVWVYSIRSGAPGRTRAYREDRDVLAGARWKPGGPEPWVGADRLDPPRADLKTPPQLYNLDAVAYESLLLGLFSIWRGQPRLTPMYDNRRSSRTKISPFANVVSRMPFFSARNHSSTCETHSARTACTWAASSDRSRSTSPVSITTVASIWACASGISVATRSAA